MKTATLLALAMLGLAGSLSAQDSIPKPKPPKKDPRVIAAWEIAQVPGVIINDVGQGGTDALRSAIIVITR